ncbi:MAG: TIGR01459 family HAD-type hydrolase [Alphaproteobacteria bacterium]|nr:TIGR01459 family HAD-type hydrolase [Alphaproteobacteria bacterium]
MSQPIRIIQGLSALAPRYDALICDVWGVIHNGREAYPGVVDCLKRARAGNKIVLLLSNAPRPSAPIMDQLESLKVPRDAYDAIVTSGDLTQSVFAERTADGKTLSVFHVGPDRDLPLFEGYNVARVAMEDAQAIVCTGPFDDTKEGPDDYRDLWTKARARDLPLICANPDLVVQRGDRLIYCAGALGKLYQEMGGDVLYLGKPHLPVYDFVARRLEQTAARAIDKRKWLAIGDGLKTDVLGATRAGIDVLLITGGIHEAELADAEGKPDPERIAHVLSHDGLKAIAAMRRLVW